MFTSLADLVGRQAPVLWFEGVAIVQAVARQLLERPEGGRSGVPDSERIVLTSEGEVVLAGAGGNGDAVNELGRLLSTLVPSEGMPAPLRQVAANATAVPPVYRELDELVGALSYFERPNQREPVRDVYERWLLLPPEDDPKPHKPAQKPPAPGDKTVPDKDRTGVEKDALRAPASAHADITTDDGPWSRRTVVVALVAVMLVGLGLPAWWVWHRLRPEPVARREPPPLIFAAAPAPVAVSSPPFRTAAAAAPASAAQRRGGAAPPRAVRLGGARTHRRTPAGPSPTSVADGPAAPGQPATYESRMQPASPVGAAASNLGLPVASDDAVDDVTIYSSDAPDVTPPVPVRQMQRSEPTAGRAQELPVVEVIVSASGEAEAVRLLKPSDDIYTIGMVSVVKAWRFNPARRNGRPVRYRYRVQLTGR